MALTENKDIPGAILGGVSEWIPGLNEIGFVEIWR